MGLPSPVRFSLHGSATLERIQVHGISLPPNPRPATFELQDSAPYGWIGKAEAEGRYIRIGTGRRSFCPRRATCSFICPKPTSPEPDRAFPLLMMHDGQNLFDGGLSYVKDSTWRVGSTADEEIAAGRVEPLVILGVANTGNERMAEYTPTADRRLSGGKGRLYARLLVEELLPMMAAAYRILPGPEHTGVAGLVAGGD